MPSGESDFEAIVLCGCEGAWMEGEERACAFCAARIFVSFDTSEHLSGQRVAYTCIGCALSRCTGEIFLTPFGEEIAERMRRA